MEAEQNSLNRQRRMLSHHTMGRFRCMTFINRNFRIAQRLKVGHS